MWPAGRSVTDTRADLDMALRLLALAEPTLAAAVQVDGVTDDGVLAIWHEVHVFLVGFR